MNVQILLNEISEHIGVPRLKKEAPTASIVAKISVAGLLVDQIATSQEIDPSSAEQIVARP